MSETIADANDDDPEWEWAVVEIFGHRRHAGRTREEERFGARMLRVDVPAVGKGEDGAHRVESWTTHYYGGSAIFSFSLTDAASVMRANRPCEAPARLTYHDDDDDDDGS